MRGAVPIDATGEAFPRGSAMYLSVDLSGASATQHVKVTWRDASGHARRSDERTAPRGAGYAAFSSGATAAWPPGPGSVLVVINDRRVAELPFTLTQRR